MQRVARPILGVGILGVGFRRVGSRGVEYVYEASAHIHTLVLFCARTCTAGCAEEAAELEVAAEEEGMAAMDGGGGWARLVCTRRDSQYH